jgi:hypothetical protein
LIRSIANALSPEGIYLILARPVTLYYFAFFLAVMPVLGLFETTRPLPNSILEPVLNSKRKSLRSS